MAFPPYNVPLVPIVIPVPAQITASAADIAIVTVPFKCRIHEIQCVAASIGGDTDPTDVDVMVENGTTDLHTIMPLVNSSTLAVGGVTATPTSAALAAIAADDVLHVDVTVTGGSNPTCDGLTVTLWVARE